MADVFTVLGQDHTEVKRMLAELDKGPSRVTGATEDQLALRKKMTEQLIIGVQARGAGGDVLLAGRA